MYPRAKRWDILWTEILESSEISRPRRPWIGATLICVGGMGGLAVGVSISMGVHSALPFHFETGSTGVSVAAGVFPFLVLLVLGCFLA
ncbi:MAG TPA: QueT transporter family protein, partial [Candidatus Methylomirabilis sp.]|nr:QueT transporter family protein [Candidatus Methylomirabilis sp.]